jgi:hypothetical protein
MIRSRESSQKRWVAVVVFAMIFAACGGGKQDSGTAAPPAQAPPPPPTPAAETVPAAETAPAAQLSWEEIDALVAPIALYPDVLVGQILAASAQPQEVLDAATWLTENDQLDPKARDAAAEKAGFSTSARGLLQFPPVLHMMAANIDWTRQLGATFATDQKAVLDSIQYLRGEARKSGALRTTPQQKVVTQMAPATATAAPAEIITIEPQDPKVVYVPQYDPATIFQAPAGTTVTTTAPDGTTTTTVVGGGTTAPAAAPTTTVVQEGHSTGSLVATGLISFGVGMILGAAIFDDHDDYYYPNYGHGGMYYGGRPWYPPPVYRPPYYPGYRPVPYYRPPPGYGNRYGNNNVNININNNYMNQWNVNNVNRPGKGSGNRKPVTRPNPNRPAPPRPTQRPATRDVASAQRPGTREVASAQRPATRDARADAQRPATRDARPEAQRPATRDAKPAAQPQAQRPTTRDTKPDAQRPTTRDTKPEAQRPATKDVSRPQGGGDRGYAKPEAARPAPAKPGGGATKETAFTKQPSGGGSSDRAASTRGKQSMKGDSGGKGKSGGKAPQPQKKAK